MVALILAAIGTLGIGGFIALAIFAPPIAASVAKGALDVVSKLWQTRIGMAAMVGVPLLLAGLSIGDWKGAGRIQAKWDAAEKAAVVRGNTAKSESEQEIAPVAPEDETPDAPPEPPPSLGSRFHFPFKIPEI